jgi:hypothetical protein
MEFVNDEAVAEATGLFQDLPVLTDDEAAELAILLLEDIELTPGQQRRLIRAIEVASRAREIADGCLLKEKPEE